VEPPDVNVSAVQFTVAGDTIRFGLAAIKNVGEAAMESILTSRRAQGAFGTLEDFCARVDLRLVNRRVVESLIKAGAFDSLGLTRAHLLATTDAALESGQRQQRDQAEGQGSFFELLPAPPARPGGPVAEVMLEWDADQRLGFEKEVLGSYFSVTQLATFRATAARRPSRTPAGSASRRARTRARCSPSCDSCARRIRAACPCSSICCWTPRKWSFGRAACPWTAVRSSSPRARRPSARARSAWTMPDALDFELPLLEIENRIAALQGNADGPRARDEIAKLEERLARLRQKTYSSLTAWQRTQLARHPKRPHTRDFFKLLFEDFVELHGDRVFGDDAAVVAGLARFEGQGVVVIGHQKGRDTREKIARNFGMPHPEGYRKALRLMHMAQQFDKPVVTFIDTPGAYP